MSKPIIKEQLFTRREVRQIINEIERDSNALLIRLARGEKVTEKMLQEELYEVCDSVHASCNDACPVFLLNNHHTVGNGDCACFKNGKAMLKFIQATKK